MVMLVAHTKTKMGNSCLHDNVVPVVKFSVMLFTSDEFELKFPELSQAEKFPRRVEPSKHFNFRAETELWLEPARLELITTIYYCSYYTVVRHISWQI